MKALRFDRFGAFRDVLRVRQLTPGFGTGELKPPRIGLTCSLSQAADAYQKVGNGDADGKVVLVFGDGA